MKIAFLGDTKLPITYEQWVELFEKHIATEDVTALNITDGDNDRSNYARRYGESHNISVNVYETAKEDEQIEGGVKSRVAKLVENSDLIVVVNSGANEEKTSFYGNLTGYGRRCMFIYYESKGKDDEFLPLRASEVISMADEIALIKQIKSEQGDVEAAKARLIACNRRHYYSFMQQQATYGIPFVELLEAFERAIKSAAFSYDETQKISFQKHTEPIIKKWVHYCKEKWDYILGKSKKPYHTRNEITQMAKHRHFDMSTINLHETEFLPISDFFVRVYSHETEPVHFHVLSKQEGFDVSFLTDGTIHEIIDSGTRANNIAAFQDIEQRAKLWLQKPAGYPYVSTVMNKENVELTWERDNSDPDWKNDTVMRVAVIGKVNPNVSYDEWVDKLQSNLNIEPYDITHFNIPVGNGILNQYVRRYAYENEILVMEYAADYKTYGDDANRLRNMALVENSDKIVGYLPKGSSKESWIFRPGIEKEANVIVIDC